MSVELAIQRAAGEGHAQGEPCAVPPDVDNWAKTILDVMKHTGYFRDDAQVCALTVCKMWGDPEGIWVRVAEMPDGPREG